MKDPKKNPILYLIAKGFISLFMLFSAWFLYTHAADFRQLGFPDYFRIELVIAKIMGAIILLLPFTPALVKEWIYAGFIIVMISALIAHIYSGDPLSRIIFVSVDTGLFFISMRYVSGKDLSQLKISKKNK